MLTDALQITIIGMTVVFVFLSLMIIVIQTNHKFMKVLNKFFPEEEEKSTQVAVKPGSQAQEVAIAIAAAQAFKNK